MPNEKYNEQPKNQQPADLWEFDNPQARQEAIDRKNLADKIKAERAELKNKNNKKINRKKGLANDQP